jgi:hypothetical protein
MDTADLAILQGIGQWWSVNGESIRGTTRTPLPVQAWGESTRKGNSLYLHVFAWPRDGKLVIGGLKTDVKQAYLLSDARSRRGSETAGTTGTNPPPRVSGYEPLKFTRLNPLDVLVQVPATAPDKVDSVVVVECGSQPVTDATRLLQPAVERDTLRVFDGQLHGRSLRFGPGKSRDADVENWSQSDEFITWPLRLNEPAAFEVSLVYDAAKASEGGAYTVKLGAQTLTGAIKAGDAVSAPLGRVQLQPGLFDLQVAPARIQGDELMRLRGVVLAPAK